MKAWNELSMAEKADVMKLAIEGGVYDLDAIRNGYNKFAEGGSKKKVTNTDEQYFTTMEKVAEDNYQKWGFSNPDEALLHALNDNTYNYRGYYNKYPNGKGNAVDHWPDEFKTVYHPTFSNESIYSGKKSQYNPLGLPGGFWSGDTFIPMAWQLDANEYKYGGGIHIDPSKKGTFTAAASKHGMGVQQFASKVLAHPENYSPAMRKKANFARNASHWKHEDGGNLYGGNNPNGQQMNVTYGRPYYSYDENGVKVDDTLNYNATFPEVIITPDSRKSPAERAILERERRRNNDAYYGNGTYNAKADREQTELEKIASQKAWETSAEKQALDYAQAAATGIGIGADMVSGLPIYSSLKGTRVLSEAETPIDYVEGGLWLAPIGGVAYQATKPAMKKGVNLVTNWANRMTSEITPENAASITSEQWDAAYRAAYEAGNKAEGQRLWDLWFKQKAPNTKQTTPMFNASGESTFNEFNGGETGLNWFSESEKYAANHGVPRAFYINEPNIYFGNVPAWIKGTPANKKYIESLKKLGYSEKQISQKVQEINEAASSTAPAAKSVGMGANNELVTRNNSTMKLAEPFTTADDGSLIDLTKRANFSNPDIRYDMPSNDIIIESSTSANPNIPFDEAWLAANKGRHQMSNLIGSNEYAGRVKQAYKDSRIPVNQADFEVMQAKQGIEDSNLKVVPNLKDANGEALNGQYDPNTRQVLVSQDRDNILDIVESSGHEHAHASEVEKLLELLKEKWKHIKPRKEAFTRNDGSIDTEWKDYISKIIEMRAPAMSVWSEMKELGFSKIGDYLHHLKRFGLEDKQWEALVNRYGLTNAKYMIETVFGLSPFVINGINNEEKDSTTM